MPTKPTILIAGGAGFLGSHLCDHYVKTHHVVCLDNLATGRQENIQHLLSDPNFTSIQADITQDLPAEVTSYHYDIVANLASPASPPHYQRLAIETLMVGSVGVLNLLELARASQARFFHASTSEVYGDPEVHPQTEAYWGHVNTYGPRSMYDESKRFAEALIYSYRHKYDLNTTMARIFNTYGPRMDPQDGRVVSNFIVQALQGQPLTIYGGGEQTRSFCYVSDLIAGFAKLIASDAEGPVNLGNPHEFTIKQLADTILRLTGSSSQLTNLPLPQDDPTQRCPDITRAKELLNWQPKIQLEAGLADTIEYFKTQATNRRITLPSAPQ